MNRDTPEEFERAFREKHLEDLEKESKRAALIAGILVTAAGIAIVVIGILNMKNYSGI